MIFFSVAFLLFLLCNTVSNCYAYRVIARGKVGAKKIITSFKFLAVDPGSQYRDSIVHSSVQALSRFTSLLSV